MPKLDAIDAPSTMSPIAIVEEPLTQIQAFIMIGTLEAVPMIGIGIAMLLLFANPIT